ncbi:DNA polymerase alpha/epsilon subunit B-domain-containing protein [Syncephalis fuscata]|nr:DNA polymerase alpha/epsilon subunit B-domain-containing protein [Syncephalis fuscata]
MVHESKVSHSATEAKLPVDHLLSNTSVDTATTAPSTLQRNAVDYDPCNEKREQLFRLKPYVTAQAQKRWSSMKNAPTLVERILDVQPGELCYVVGTMYVDMKLKPNVLEDIAQEVNSHITSIIAAVLGRENALGEFEIVDMCFAGLPPPSSSIDTMEHTSTEDEPVKYLALVSGLQIGSDKENSLQTQLLAQYLRGELGSLHDQIEQTNIVRVILAGNTVVPPTIEQDDWQTRRANRQNSMIVDGNTDTPNSLQQADLFLEQVCASIDVDILPGSLDPVTMALPQQPIYPGLLPKASKYSTLQCVTNPYWCRVQDRLLLGNAGQPVTDLCKYVQDKSALDLAVSSLTWRHMAPTAPDTLWCYPFADKDPFIIEECPSIYFIGNQTEYDTQLVEGSEGQRVRVVTLPSFAETGMVILVNLSTLDCHAVSLQTQLF